MLSMYVQFGTHRHFHGRIIAVLTQNPTVLAEICINMGIFCSFRAMVPGENIRGSCRWWPVMGSCSWHGMPIISTMLTTLIVCWHIEAETKWPPCSRRHFQMYFLYWKFLYFDENFNEMRSPWSNQQYSIIGSDNGLAPVRRQAIIWTNDGLV